MPTPTHPSKDDNPSTYFIDSSDTRETMRLVLQSNVLTKIMGGPLSEQANLSRIHTVLDIGCGPGDWALEVASLYPHMHVVGMDISRRMIEYANAQANAQGIANVEFEVADVLKPWRVADHPFDLINGRLLASFVPKEAWPKLIQECLNVLHPGGILRLTEQEIGFSNGEACEKLSHKITLAMLRAGTAFSPDGHKIGITLVIRDFLQQAGLTAIDKRAYALEYSYGAEAHGSFVQNMEFGYPLLAPFMMRYGTTTQEEFETLYQQAIAEAKNERFRAMTFLLTVWGQKEAHGS